MQQDTRKVGSALGFHNPTDPTQVTQVTHT